MGNQSRSAPRPNASIWSNSFAPADVAEVSWESAEWFLPPLGSWALPRFSSFRTAKSSPSKNASSPQADKPSTLKAIHYPTRIHPE